MNEIITTPDVERAAGPDADTAGAAPQGGRRALLRKVAIGSAGAAAAALALDRTALAGDESGDQVDGNAVELGEVNTAVSPTVVAVTPAEPVTAGPSAFSATAHELAEDAPFPAAIGGYGDENVLNGVHGSTIDGTGFGVVAANLAPVAAADTDAAPVALALASNGAHIRFLQLEDAVAGPSEGLHTAGELYVDAAGALWFTVPVPAVAPATEPGVRFVQLGGPTTAGAFHALPVAKRVFDSRLGTGAAKINEDATVAIDVTKDIDAAASGFPVGASLALVNLTVTQTEGAGFVTLFATGTPLAEVKTSNINWFSDGTSIANNSGVPVSAAGSITARVGGNATDGVSVRTHVVVDLVGYYL